MSDVDPWTRATIDRSTLIRRLADQDDQEAWQIVHDRYVPVLLAFGRRLGVDRASMEDVGQETMMAFAVSVRSGKYDRSRGRLRDFLFGIARNKVRDLMRARVKGPVQVVDSVDQTDFFERRPDEDGWDQQWEKEWSLAVSRQCLIEAMERFTPETYRLFYMRAIEGRSSKDVAAAEDKTVNAVDVAVAKVRAFLRRIRPEIEEIF